MRMPRISARYRAAALTAAICVALTMLAIVGVYHRLPTRKTDLQAGSVWLVSNRVGELTLVDGVTVEVAARVKVAQPGTTLSATQPVADAYVVNHSNGTISRVDDSTHRVSSPARLLHASAKDVQPFVSDDVVYALGRQPGRLAFADPGTMVSTGGPISVAADAQATLTDRSTLWLLDPESGDLSRYSGKNHTSRSGAAKPGGSLYSTASRYPVLLDKAAGVATQLEPDSGAPRRSIRTESLSGDVVVGSDATQGLLIARPAHHSLVICRFGETSCQAPIYLGQSAVDLGPPVEVDNHILVPDYRNGTVWIINLALPAVTAQPVIFNQAKRFQLLVRHGIVYYNDPNSEHAGVIRLDGRVLPLVKYQLSGPKPSIQATTPSARQTRTPSIVPTPRTTGPHSSGRPQPTATATGSGRATAGGSNRPSATVTGTPTNDLRILRFNFAPGTPQAGQETHLSAAIVGGPATRWQWSIRRPDNTVETSSTAEDFSHTFTTPATYRVNLLVTADGESDEYAENLTVVPYSPPLQCGDAITVSTTLTRDLTCSGIALLIEADDVVLDLGGYTIRGANDSAFGVILNGDIDPSNVTIRNGRMERLGRPINVDGVEGLTISNVQFINNGSVTPGGPSRNTSILGGEIRGSNISTNVGTGFRFVGVSISTSRLNISADSNGASIINNTLVDTPIRVIASDQVRIEDNRITRGEIEFYPDSIAGVINRNRLTDGGGMILSPPDTEVTSNVVLGATYGLRTSVDPAPDGVFEDFLVRGNTFRDNRVAGIYIIGDDLTDESNPIVLSDNILEGNGHRADGARDPAGKPINDGLHIAVPAGSRVIVSDNAASGNADYGIEATPGSVTDGGGNSSSGDPHGCIGVRCA